ncbi:hypothetical protein [Paracoccus sp. (in: a-proteobacteria)]|uniref:hypothetical protein n=1 Tax=Paracoccus sp. TaxID=267 RepID=UPI00321FC060
MAHYDPNDPKRTESSDPHRPAGSQPATDPAQLRASPLPLVIGVLLALAVAYFALQYFMAGNQVGTTGEDAAVTTTAPADAGSEPQEGAAAPLEKARDAARAVVGQAADAAGEAARAGAAAVTTAVTETSEAAGAAAERAAEAVGAAAGKASDAAGAALQGAGEAARDAVNRAGEALDAATGTARPAEGTTAAPAN